MSEYTGYVLPNGLKLLVHQDESIGIAAVNLMYDVGSRDEDPAMTGLAHLFEHMMFEGSANVPVFDRELERAGGENNAFTNNDITNYYITLPAKNLETALWLESDRMQALSLDEKKLEIQKNVVMEEFKERYLDQPYGDLWALARQLSYKVHPYRWPTIGIDLEHIRKVQTKDVKAFYNRFYTPDNALLSIVSPFSAEHVIKLVRKWFLPIAPAKIRFKRRLPVEPPQKQQRTLEVTRKVPASIILRTYPMAGRNDSAYYTHDLISDILGSGESSRLKYALTREQELFSQIDAYITGDIDPGLLVIAGKVNENTHLDQANQAITRELQKITRQMPSPKEVQKAKNKALVRLEEDKNGALEKAMNLAFFQLLGDASRFSRQNELYERITPQMIGQQCRKLFSQNNENILVYKMNPTENQS